MVRRKSDCSTFYSVKDPYRDINIFYKSLFPNSTNRKMVDCVICCENDNRKLYSLCKTCVNDDKQICAECLAKLLKFDGAVSLSQPFIAMHLECPFCRCKIPESVIRTDPFGSSIDFFKKSSHVYREFSNLLLEDRSCLNAIVEDLLGATRYARRRARSARAWWEIRERQAQSLDPNTVVAPPQSIQDIFGDVVNTMIVTDVSIFSDTTDSNTEDNTDQPSPEEEAIDDS